MCAFLSVNSSFLPFCFYFFLSPLLGFINLNPASPYPPCSLSLNDYIPQASALLSSPLQSCSSCPVHKYLSLFSFSTPFSSLPLSLRMAFQGHRKGYIIFSRHLPRLPGSFCFLPPPHHLVLSGLPDVLPCHLDASAQSISLMTRSQTQQPSLTKTEKLERPLTFCKISVVMLLEIWFFVNTYPINWKNALTRDSLCMFQSLGK